MLMVTSQKFAWVKCYLMNLIIVGESWGKVPPWDPPNYLHFYRPRVMFLLPCVIPFPGAGSASREVCMGVCMGAVSTCKVLADIPAGTRNAGGMHAIGVLSCFFAALSQSIGGPKGGVRSMRPLGPLFLVISGLGKGNGQILGWRATPYGVVAPPPSWKSCIRLSNRFRIFEYIILILVNTKQTHTFQVNSSGNEISFCIFPNSHKILWVLQQELIFKTFISV